MGKGICPFPIVAFGAIVVFYTSLLRRVKDDDDDETKRTKTSSTITNSTTTTSSSKMSAKSDTKYQVVFVLGGPGAGKGTQCTRLSTDFKWTHLSAGDLLRAERKKSDSELGTLINNCIADGRLVPSEITVRLLKNAMTETDTTKFLIDGFPRSEGNLTAWNDVMSSIATVEFVLFLDCPEDVMTERLLDRGLTSGRSDDNVAVIKKRFETFRVESLPIVEVYEKEGRVRRIVADKSVEEVYAEVSRLFEGL